MISARAGRLAVAVGCAAFVAVSLPYLDRVPPIHNDEPTILAPGVKLFTRGVFGLDMLDGLGGADRHYLEVMPAMSVLEGAVARVAGVGVWQMRLVPVALGAATLALACLLALRLAGPTAAAATAALLLLWQWTPGRGEFLPSGIPLVDVARIARYDVLAAALGLAALAVFASPRTPGSPARHLASGALVGLATLATPYGAFWGAALVTLAFLAPPPAAPGRRARDAALLAAGTIAVVLPWALLALANRGDLLAQLARHSGRFGFASPGFYLASALHEAERYQLGLRDPASLLRVGLWLLVLGVPAAFVWLLRRAVRSGERAPLTLLVPCAVFPLLLALLVNVKRFYYLVSVAPLFAVLLAWAITALLRTARPILRWAAAAVLAVAALQGGAALARMERAAAAVAPPGRFLAGLRAAVAPGARRIVGPHGHWFAFADREFLSFTVPVSLMAAGGCSLAEALVRLAPDAVILTPDVLDAYTRQRIGPGPADEAALRAVLGGLGMRPTSRLVDNRGVPVEVWQTVAAPPPPG